VLTSPAELPETVLLEALEQGWGLRGGPLTYRAVGFGSHHWTTGDGRWFVTVDDLRTRRMATGEPLSACLDRLRGALGAATQLRAAGLEFVVAPVPAADGEPVTPVAGCFAVAVHPFVDGESYPSGEFTPAHREAVLDLLAVVHGVPVTAPADDYRIPLRDAVTATVRDGVPVTGPYADPAAALLTEHAAAVRDAYARYDALAAAARAAAPAFVLTHGEPHPANTMQAGGRWLLIDWDTALLAPPERDLWDLDPGDGGAHAHFAEDTGTPLRPALLDWSHTSRR
jgi:spectinomycin phosphotransferase/16S rRNA (guanine(1405)-N(7))-methyltransferase